MDQDQKKTDGCTDGRATRIVYTVMNISFQTVKLMQTVQTQISLLLEEPPDQDLYCLPFHSHSDSQAYANSADPDQTAPR